MAMKEHRFSPRLMVLLSMAVFGTIAPFVRAVPLSSGGLALCRAVLASLFLLAVFAVTGQKPPVKGLGRALPLLLASGACMGINWILLFESFRHTTVAVATLSYYFAPVLVTAVCPILFRERMSRRSIFCFVMSTAGLVLVILGGGAGQGSDHLTGVLLGLGAAVFYAAVILLNKFIRGVEGIFRTFWQFLAAIAVLIPYVLCTGGISFGGMDSKGWLCLLVVGLVHTGAAYCLYFSGLKELPGHEAAILSYIDPLVAVLVSVLVLGEGVVPLQLLGGAMVLGFTLWNELPGRTGKTAN